jgi:hypothetical protein
LVPLWRLRICLRPLLDSTGIALGAKVKFVVHSSASFSRAADLHKIARVCCAVQSILYITKRMDLHSPYKFRCPFCLFSFLSRWWEDEKESATTKLIYLEENAERESIWTKSKVWRRRLGCCSYNMSPRLYRWSLWPLPVLFYKSRSLGFDVQPKPTPIQWLDAQKKRYIVQTI